MYKRMMQKIKEDIKNKEIEQVYLASKLGCSKNLLQAYLKGDTKMKFVSFHRLVSQVYENEGLVIQLLKEFVNLVQKQNEIKEILEWSYHNGRIDIFEIAIDRADNETNRVYGLFFKRVTKKIEPIQFFEEVENTQFNKRVDPDIQFFLRIMRVYAYMDLKKYDVINVHVGLLLKNVNGIQSSYLKKAYRMRLLELSAISYLKDDDIENTRETALKIIREDEDDEFQYIVNSMHCLLAESYIFCDKKSSLEWIMKAIRMVEDIKYRNYEYRKYTLKATHDFIKIHFNDFDGLYLEDPAEKAHFYARNGKDSDKALEILESMNSSLSPHQLYYYALATKSQKDFEKAKRAFYKNGDLFYLRLIG